MACNSRVTFFIPILCPNVITPGPSYRTLYRVFHNYGDVPLTYQFPLSMYLSFPYFCASYTEILFTVCRIAAGA